MTTEWRKPYTHLNHLQGASACLEGSVQKLKASVNALDTVVQDYDRLRKNAQFQMHYEILSIDDIRHAESEVISKRLPEIESLLSRAQAGIGALEKEVKAVESKVDEQTEQIKSLEQSSSSSSTRGERIQPKKTESYDIQQLQKRKRALEREMEAVEKELHESQAKMDQLRSAAQVDSAPSVDHAPMSPNDQTMTAQDVHTLKQVKALARLIVPEASAMVTQLLDTHCKDEMN